MWERLQRAEVVDSSCINKLHAHLACHAKLEINERCERRFAKWIVEQEQASVALPRMLRARFLTSAQSHQNAVKDDRGGELLAIGELLNQGHYVVTASAQIILGF